MVEIAIGAVIPATHLAAQLEWLSHAVKGLRFDFKIDKPPGEAEMRQIKLKDVGYKKIQLKI